MTDPHDPGGLSPAAVEQIEGAGLTVDGYVRWTWPDGVWGGDRCGCTDDRCVGFHHDEREPCGCLPVLLEQAAAQLR